MLGPLPTVDAESSRSAVLAFGKHKGLTFEQAFARDKLYIGWALQEPRTGQLHEFAAYCRARLGTTTASVQQPQHRRIAASSSSTGSDPLPSGSNGRAPTPTTQVATPSVSPLVSPAELAAPQTTAAAAPATSDRPVLHHQNATALDRSAAVAPAPVAVRTATRSSPYDAAMHSESRLVADAGKAIVAFGQHKGLTFAELFSREKSYVAWVLREPRNGQMNEFANYCKVRKHTASVSCLLPQHLPAPAAMAAAASSDQVPFSAGIDHVAHTPAVEAAVPGVPQSASFSSEGSAPQQTPATTSAAPGSSSGAPDHLSRSAASGPSGDAHHLPAPSNLAAATPSAPSASGSPARRPHDGCSMSGPGFVAASSSSRHPDLQYSSTVFSYTKHKGKTFADVFRDESKKKDNYIDWVHRKKPTSGQLYEFALYCTARTGGASNAPPPTGDGGVGRVAAPTSSNPASPKRKLDAQASDPGAGKRRSTGSAGGEEDDNCGDDNCCDKCSTTELPFPGATRCGACWKEYYKVCDADFYLRSSFEDKDKVRSRGARWDPQYRKWFVPAGRDMSKLEPWFVLCTKCKEPLSDLDLPKTPVCTPECNVDRESREYKARMERERKELEELKKLRAEEAERRRETLKVAIKKEFVKFVKDIAHKTQMMMEERNQSAQEKEEKLIPFLLVDGGLENYTETKFCSGATYNPFNADDPDVLPVDVILWMRRFGTKDFSKANFFHNIEYSVDKIIDWAVTFHQQFIDTWIDEAADLRCHVRAQERFLEHLLRQCLDPVTPDLKAMIQDRLRSLHGTCCPDIVGIFGSRILPRIRLTLGDGDYSRLTRGQKCDWCVVEYMQNRKRYDSAVKETEETTYMRDLLNKVIEDLTADGSLVTQLSEDDSDALCYAAGEKGQRQMFMVRNPNTAAVDLFSADVVDAAVAWMNSNDNPNANSEVVESPDAAELRQRIFAVFRTLHWRVARKLTGGSFAVYGVAEGLREEDGDVRMAKIKLEHHRYHTMMLKKRWTPRDFCGHESKRLHSNTELVELLFAQHLKIEEGKVKKAKKTAERYIKDLRKKLDKEQGKMKKSLKASGAKWQELVDT